MVPALVVFALAAVASPDGDLLAVGAPAPDVIGKDAKGKTVRLAAQKGKVAVVYFYPKDDTTGCTKEACAFRDNLDKFGKAGVTVFGVSRDSEASHRAFQDKYQLPFPLVADPSGAVQRAYRVPNAGPDAEVAARVTFLVGPDGKIARVWPQVDPTLHAGEVLDAITAAKAAARPNRDRDTAPSNLPKSTR